MAPRLRTNVARTTFPELPGAVFFGTVIESDITMARRLQAIRAEFESSDDEATLWQDLEAMGFDAGEIRKAVANPSIITACGYGIPT